MSTHTLSFDPQVTEGFDICSQLQNGPVNRAGRPVEPIVIADSGRVT